MAEYSATRRTPRKHKRVVMKGTEQFDADGVKLEPGDMQTDQQRQLTTTNAPSANCRRIGPFLTSASGVGAHSVFNMCFPQPTGCGKHSIG